MTNLNEVRWTPDGKGGAMLVLDGEQAGYIGSEHLAADLVGHVEKCRAALQMICDYWGACADSARRDGLLMNHPACHAVADMPELASLVQKAWLLTADALGLDPEMPDWATTTQARCAAHSMELHRTLRVLTNAVQATHLDKPGAELRGALAQAYMDAQQMLARVEEESE